MPISKSLKCFLELPNVFSKLMSYVRKVEISNPDIIDHFLKAKLWKNIKSKFVGKIVIPLTIYFDNLEINNPPVRTTYLGK